MPAATLLHQIEPALSYWGWIVILAAASAFVIRLAMHAGSEDQTEAEDIHLNW